MASEAKFDLEGQKSFWEKPAHIIKEVVRKIGYADVCNCSGDKWVKNLHFGLRGHFWPLRSKIILRKTCGYYQRSSQKKNYVDMCYGSWVIWVWNLHFGLKGQVWPRGSKFILWNLWRFGILTCMQNLVLIWSVVFELFAYFCT